MMAVAVTEFLTDMAVEVTVIGRPFSNARIPEKVS